MKTARGHVRRDLALMLLGGAVSACQESGRGGVVALVGGSGSGLSVVAQQFVDESGYAARLHSAETGQSQLPVLRGINVLDEGWQFANAREAILESVTAGRGTVIVVCRSVEEANELVAPLDVRVVPVTHWRTARSLESQQAE